MALRNLDNTLKLALIDNVPLQVYHLVKFEKPSNILYTEENIPTTAFSYLTDAPYPVDFGGSTYNCTNFSSIGDVSEDVVAKATGMTLALNANNLGREAVVTASISIGAVGASTTIIMDLDLFQAGFQIGDEVTFTNANHTVEARIDRLYSGTNTERADVTLLSSVTSAISNEVMTVSYNSASVVGLTGSATSLNYQNYINKNVFIHRCFVNPKTGNLYGNPVLLFEGIIAKGALKESGDKKSIMTWTLTSHWGDFVRVQGRLTSDEFHQALDGSGTSVRSALLKPEYEGDKGFEHSEKSLNVLAPYIDTATRPKLKKSSSYFGLRQSYSQVEETYEIKKELDLSINLAAKFLPVVYGVNRISCIPVFADIELGEFGSVDNGSQSARTTDLWTANAISEGPIRAIYDVIVDDEGLVCRDLKDADQRGEGNSVDSYTGSLCVGNMTKGDVLAGISEYNYSGEDFTRAEIAIRYTQENWNAWEAALNDSLGALEALDGQPYTAPQPVDITDPTQFRAVGPIGLTHQKNFNFNFGGDNDFINITLHAGLLFQPPDANLLTIARNKKFKIQNSYYEGSTDIRDYWSKDHRLADTSYVVQKDSISASSGQQPAFDYIVKGKYVNCVNYDGSYKGLVPAARNTSYNLGDIVQLTVTSGGSTSTTTARIADKWYMYDIVGTQDWRFKFESVSGSNVSLVDLVTTGEAPYIVMRPLDSSNNPISGVDWVMSKETYTGNVAAPEYTPDSSIKYDVGGLIIDGTSASFVLNSVDLIFERYTEQVDNPFYDPYGDDEVTGSDPFVEINTVLYGLDLHELYTDAFAKTAIETVAAIGPSGGVINITTAFGNQYFNIPLRAKTIAASFTSERQGLVIISEQSTEPLSYLDNFMRALQVARTNGIISTAYSLVTDGTTVLGDYYSNQGGTLIGVRSLINSNIPTTRIYSYNLIQQDPTDTFVPSTIASRLRINFIEGDSTLARTHTFVNTPDDSTLSAWCDTNNVLCLVATMNLAHHMDLIRGSGFPATDYDYYYGAEEDGSDVGEAALEISPQDARVTNNPAMILLDYLLSRRYGKGLKPSLIDFASFKEAARTCDEGSDVTIQVVQASSTLGSTAVGNLCRYPADVSQPILFQGTIKEINLNTASVEVSAGSTQNVHEITFTNCTGKLGRAWRNSEVYYANEIVWSKGGGCTVVSSTGTTTDPGTTSQSTPIQIRNLTLNSTLTIDHQHSRNLEITASSGQYPNTSFKAPSGNPIVKQIDKSTGVARILSGYSLYDSDEVRYWKYLGWDSWDQRWVTRHQINPVIDTSQKLSENVNTLLAQFNGILRYSNGKYFLDIKTKAKPLADFDTNVEVITEEDIIGDIKLDDKGISKTFNAFSAQISDPSLLFANRTVSFFNSNYLLQDKGIPRQGTYRAPAITNYFNLRLNAQQALDESRAGLTISFTMAPKGYLLLAGNIILITYAQFNWVNKLFRIESLKIKSNLLVNVVAVEHNDEAYLLKSMANDIVTPYGEPASHSDILIDRPVNLIASNIVKEQGAVGGINLDWTNTPDYNSSTHSVEVWVSPTSSFADATHTLTASGGTITDPVLDESGTAIRYYWIRYKVAAGLNSSSNNLDPIFSKFYPSTTQRGIKGVGAASTPERIHGIVKGATSNTNAKISNDISQEIFSLGANWTTSSTPAGAHTVRRLTQPGGTKRYDFVWNGLLLAQKFRGPSDTHTLSDITLTVLGETYYVGSIQSSYSTTSTITEGTQNWDFFSIKTTRTDGIAQGTEKFIFDDYSASLASHAAPTNPGDLTQVNAELDLSNISDSDARELYVIFDHSTPKCFLAQWDKTSNTQGPPYWRDIGDGTATLSTAWASISGTSFTDVAGFNIKGVGTSFLTDLVEGDVVAFLAAPLTSSSTTVGSYSATVQEVFSDTLFRVDVQNSGASSTINYLYKTSYRPDLENDAVIAEINRGS